MLNLAIIIPSLTTGGAENMVARLVENIDSKINVHLLVLYPPQNSFLESILLQSGVQVKFFHKKLGFSISTLRKISRYLKKFQPDIIHTHLTTCLYAIPYAFIHKIKIIHTIHSEPQQIPKIARNIMRILYHYSLAIPVAVSDIISKHAASLFKLPSDCIKTIYNPVELEKYERKIKKDVSAIIFINVARFAMPKDHEGLVRAFALAHKELPNAQLVLVGDGELRLEVEKCVHALDLENAVSFTGTVSDVPKRLMDADVFVFSSNYEGLPLAILEAMAAGLPVVATAVGGVPDIIRDNGILVKRGDLDSMAKAMVLLGKNESLRKDMSKSALEMVKEFDIKKIVKQYESLYMEYGCKKNRI